MSMNSIEKISAPREIGKTWHAEQRSILGGSKLIEQTLNILGRITFAWRPTKVSSFYLGSVWEFHNCNRVPFETN